METMIVQLRERCACGSEWEFRRDVPGQMDGFDWREDRQVWRDTHPCSVPGEWTVPTSQQAPQVWTRADDVLSYTDYVCSTPPVPFTVEDDVPSYTDYVFETLPRRGG